MKRGCGDFIRLLLGEHSPDALLHLAGCLVREGDGQDFGGGSASRDEPGDAGYNGPSFSCPCAREDQQWPVLMGGCALLFGVEVIKAEAGHCGSKVARESATRRPTAQGLDFL